MNLEKKKWNSTYFKKQNKRDRSNNVRKLKILMKKIGAIKKED